MHLGGTDMKNSNDSLKEKAIDQKELESVSGGGILSWGYYIDTNICKSNKCKTAGCQMKCCHPTAIEVVQYKNKRSNDWFDYDLCVYACIDSRSCAFCWNCDAKKGCYYGAIKNVD
jgi:hypothetical protein